jgi:peptidoglycan/xylan/chitin deacetylase (PgdA/CDA1 family)
MHLEEIVDLLATGRPLPARAVAVTFDDGYRDNYSQAFPVIQEARCPTTIFLTAGLIGTRQILWWNQLSYAVVQTRKSRPEVDRIMRAHDLPLPNWNGDPDVEETIEAVKRRRARHEQQVVESIAAALDVDTSKNTDDVMMTWEEAREMADSGLVTLGAHSLTHSNLKELTLDEVRTEVMGSKAVIEEKLGRPVRLFAYPFGFPVNDYTDEVKAIVQEAGLTCAVTVVLGLAEHGVDLYEIPRFCETVERWQGPGGGFSRALFDMYLTGARPSLDRWRPDLLLRRKGVS